MNKLIRRMLENRGYTDEFLRSINTCEHELPTNIDDMCRRLNHYHDTRERVVLLTDFDMDGIMCGVIGFAGMAELGFNVALYLPETDVYGFDEEDIDRILDDYPDVKAIVTADVGITAYDGVRYASEHNIEMLLTDHHVPGTTVVPGSSVIVDPMQDQDDAHFGQICGAHVIYLVLRYYAEYYAADPTQMIPQIERLRVFAGFGTISDSMPVYFENRPLIRDAVSICRLIYADGDADVAAMIPGCDIYRRAFIGLHVLLSVFHENGKFRDTSDIDEEFFAFYVVPAFNSIKRMRADISDAYNVFFAGADTALVSMQHILQLTEERKKLVSDSVDEMLSPSTPQPWAPYIYVTKSPAGLRGLLAQRVLSLTGEPALVVGQGADGTFVGSGRCPVWFPFLDVTRDLDYVHPAGHNVAFGVSLDNTKACDDLVAFLHQEIEARRPDDIEALNRPDFKISTVDDNADTDIDLKLFEEFLSEIDSYRPFGSGFSAPEAELEFRPSEGIWSYLGHDKKHIKVNLPHGLALLCFNQADYFPDKIDPDLFPEVTSVRGKLNLNEFAGVQTIQFLGSLKPEMNQSTDLFDQNDDAAAVMVFDSKGDKE